LDYLSIRAIHVACAGISIVLFALRAALQSSGVDWRRWRWLLVAPHVNDTLLLAAGVALAVMSAQFPLLQPWLTAKVLALFAYIAFGVIALGRNVPPRRRRLALAAALATFSYIVGVAVSRSASVF
jgi:uncharacterized membrane protein SirB2